jgi:mannose-1-phosphate guanylyltransferase
MIMAGGSGTRLWPLSTAGEPKQLAPLIDGKCLLRIAYERLAGLIDADHRWICAGGRHREAIKRAVPGFTDGRFLGEPMGRDTVNAVALTAAVLEKVDPGCSFAVLTADHLIEPRDVFLESVRNAFELVEADARRLVTFSITPTFPATGYGYVERDKPIAGAPTGAFRVSRYVEKPDLETAKRYVQSGRFGWNSGMFVWKASTVLEALDAYKPESCQGARTIAEAWGSADFSRVIGDVYPTLPKISVDYALMEPASTDDRYEVCTVATDVSWRDVGSWSSLAEIIEADAAGNRVSGDWATLRDCRDSFVFNADEGHHIALLGCEGLTVVRTKDATLVMPSAMAEHLKELHATLPESLR